MIVLKRVYQPLGFQTPNGNKAEEYGDDLRKKLHKHDLTRISIKKPGLIEKRINDGTKKLFERIESLTALPVVD